MNMFFFFFVVKKLLKSLNIHQLNQPSNFPITQYDKYFNEYFSFFYFTKFDCEISGACLHCKKEKYFSPSSILSHSLLSSLFSPHFLFSHSLSLSLDALFLLKFLHTCFSFKFSQSVS